MAILVSERIKKLREEIAAISEANRTHMHRRDAGVAADQERRLQRLQFELELVALIEADRVALLHSKAWKCLWCLRRGLPERGIFSYRTRGQVRLIRLPIAQADTRLLT